MAITFIDVSSYLVFSYGGPQGNGGVRASISLGVQNAFVSLEFYPDGSPMPANSAGNHISGKRMFSVSYPYSQYAGILDLLRNERPIKFFFRDESLIGYVTTSNEPVGENE